ncbi:Cilia- and flagella-associated protein 45 [Cichlidogyrus casuarinus]|uniref:Cilia- and flagella-associated protein 45 n=1 Tax=Cichlidogyrus casuarinus TaxID=1844966 RepID=A0ABD2QGC5_9PLAT
MAASQKRRMDMKIKDMQREKKEGMNDLELEAKNNSQGMLKKAMLAKQEQEDEIKLLNKWINNAKIQAIRDAQILEKEQIKRELFDEDCRLNEMMEIDRKKAIAIQEAIEGKKRENELKGAVAILKQIEENAEEKLIEQEKVQQEHETYKRKLQDMMEEEIRKRSNKRELQAKVKEQLDIANRAMIEKRREEKEHEYLFNEKIRAIQEEKARKEAELEEEQIKKKIEKEKEVARLRSMQERQNDEAAGKDELRAKRATEANEREWRRKELEAAKKKADDIKRMRHEHAVQSEFKRQLMAVQAERERREFENILNLQKALICKDSEEEKKSAAIKLKNAEELRLQIQSREMERIAARNAFFEEGNKLAEEARMRRMRVEEAKDRKVKEFGTYGLPTKYLKMVEERVRAMQIK